MFRPTSHLEAFFLCDLYAGQIIMVRAKRRLPYNKLNARTRARRRSSARAHTHIPASTRIFAPMPFQTFPFALRYKLTRYIPIVYSLYTICQYIRTSKKYSTFMPPLNSHTCHCITSQAQTAQPKQKAWRQAGS